MSHLLERLAKKGRKKSPSCEAKRHLGLCAREGKKGAVGKNSSLIILLAVYLVGFFK